MKITVVKAPGVEIEVVQEVSIHAPRDSVYFVPSDMDFITFGITIREVERQRNEWIRKYDNLYNGLKYWRDKALTK